MVGELVFDDLAVPSHDDRVGQVSHHKVRRLYVDPTAFTSVVDPHRCDANPDPNFHVDTDPHADPIPQVLHLLENQNFFYLQSQQLQFTMFYLSHQCQMWHSFQYFGQHVKKIYIKIFWKKV
jgi:hypothetical protein